MIEAHCLTEKNDGKPLAGPGPVPAQDCRMIRELLAEQALDVLPPKIAGAVASHLVSCPACRDEHDCLAAVAAHLTLVRDALAHDAGQRRRTGGSGRAGRRRTTPPGPRRPGPDLPGPAARLTLSEWVSRTTCAR